VTCSLTDSALEAATGVALEPAIGIESIDAQGIRYDLRTLAGLNLLHGPLAQGFLFTTRELAAIVGLRQLEAYHATIRGATYETFSKQTFVYVFYKICKEE